MNKSVKLGHDHLGRSVMKAITFRVLALTFDLAVVALITGRVEVAVGVVLLTNTLNTGLYFFHERVWNKVHWGRR